MIIKTKKVMRFIPMLDVYPFMKVDVTTADESFDHPSMEEWIDQNLFISSQNSSKPLHVLYRNLAESLFIMYEHIIEVVISTDKESFTYTLDV